jgi:hypothetical protein
LFQRRPVVAIASARGKLAPDPLALGRFFIHMP